MKKALKSLFCALGLIVPSLVMASTTTPRTGLTIPAFGDQNWDVQLRADFNIIDASMCVQALPNTFVSSQTFTGPILMQNQPIYFYDASGNRYIQLKASNTVTSTVFTLPAADGIAGQVLSTDGFGDWSFVNGGSGGSILGSNNTWTGTNMFNNAVTVAANASFTGLLSANNIDTTGGSTGAISTKSLNVTGNQIIFGSFPNSILGTDSGGLLINATIPPTRSITSSAANDTGLAINMTGASSISPVIGQAITINSSGANNSAGTNIFNSGANSGINYGVFSQAVPTAGTAVSGLFSASGPNNNYGLQTLAQGSGINYGIQTTARFGSANHAINMIAGDLALNGSAGTSGQFLISAGTGTIPFWSTLANSGFVTNQDTLQSGTTFYVSSGTVKGNLTAGNVFLSGISNGNCLQTGPQGQIFGTGFACGSGAGSGIQNTDTLQSGSTFYVSSGTVNGNFYIVPTGNFGALYLTPGTFSTPAALGATGNLELDAGSSAIETFYQSTHNGIPGPSAQVFGNLSLSNSSGQSTLYLRQQNAGFNYIGFVASQTVTGTTFVLPNADGTNGQALITDGSHNLSFGTIAGTSIYAATATASFPFGMAGSTFSFVGPSPSTVTYGLAVGSLTVNGIAGQAGAWQALEGTTPSGVSGYITLTADTTGPALKEIVDAGATYYVDTSSVAATAGHVVGWGPGGLGQLVDIGPYPTATPGGPTGAIQYNGGGSTFGGSNNWQITGGSITVISSMSVTTAGGKTNGADAGYFDVFHSTAFAGQFLFTVGSLTNGHQFYVADQKPVNMALYGNQSGLLSIGQAGTADGTQVIWDNNISPLQKIDFGTTGYMQLETAANDILFAPETAVTLDLNKFGATFTSSVTVMAPNTGQYSVTIATSTSQFQVVITTAGGVGFFNRTLAQILASTPTVTGETYYCADCAFTPLCVSTSTLVGRFAAMNNKNTICN